jgi:4-hydroxymandelate oxidase
MTTEIKTVEDVRNTAREKLKGICGVYKDCDGDSRRLCQGQSYGRALGFNIYKRTSFFH